MAKRTWKNAPKRSAPAVRRSPGKIALPKPQAVSAPSSTFKPSGDSRRDSLMQQIDSAQQALNRESASGFGDRSEKAARHLDSLNKQLADYDASGFGPRAVEIAKTAVPAAGGGYLGYRIARNMGASNADRAEQAITRFNAVAKTVERLRKNTPNGIVGTKAGDKMIALVNEGFVLGGSKQPFRSVPSKTTSILANARPLFAKAGGKFGLALFAGLAAEGIASRYVLPHYTDDKVLKEGLAITGTASMAAALTYAMKRKIDMAAPGLRPASTEIAKVTAAHGQIVREIGTKPASAATLGRWAAVRAASRAVLPAAIGAAAVLAISKSAKAGESRTVQVAKGFAAGANEAAMGVPQAAEGYFNARGTSTLGFIHGTLSRALGARRTVAAAAATRARPVVPEARKQSLSRRGAAPVTVSNGRVESYYRVQGGKSVFVQGYSRN